MIGKKKRKNGLCISFGYILTGKGAEGVKGQKYTKSYLGLDCGWVYYSINYDRIYKGEISSDFPNLKMELS